MGGVRRWAGPTAMAAFAVHLGERIAETGRCDAAAWGVACWVVCGAGLWAAAAAISWRIDAVGDHPPERPAIAGRIGAAELESAHAAAPDAVSPNSAA